MDPGNSDHNSYCTCRACDFSAALSRRQLLRAGAAGAIAATGVAAPIGDATRAQQLGSTNAPARPILIKDGCVLTLDRGVGDFDQADVLLERGKIAAVR